MSNSTLARLRRERLKGSPSCRNLGELDATVAIDTMGYRQLCFWAMLGRRQRWSSTVVRRAALRSCYGGWVQAWEKAISGYADLDQYWRGFANKLSELYAEVFVGPAVMSRRPGLQRQAS